MLSMASKLDKLRPSISVAIVSSSLLDELLGIPKPACVILRVGLEAGGVKIGTAFNERLGNSIPERCVHKI